MKTRDKSPAGTATKTKPARRRRSAPERSQRQPQIEVVYTPAKPFNLNRFLLRVLTVAAVVLALVFGMSIFFKAQYVTVSGTEKYTPWEIKEASGIQETDALLGISEARIGARIRAKLPYVYSVRVGIKLPDTVNIEIKEVDIVYAIEDVSHAWWLMDASGRIVEATNGAAAKDYTRVLGLRIDNAVVGKPATVSEPENTESHDPTGTEQPPTGATLPPISPQQQLEAAIAIMTALEQNGIMGKIDTIDLTDVSQLSMWYGDRYQISLGDISRMEYKIGAMKAAIQKMGEYQSGYLDVSFTTWPTQVGYTPFETE